MKKIIVAVSVAVLSCCLICSLLGQTSGAQIPAPTASAAGEDRTSDASRISLPQDSAAKATKLLPAEKSGVSQQIVAAVAGVWGTVKNFHHNHIIWAILLDLCVISFAIGIAANVIVQWGTYTWYVIVILVAFCWTVVSGDLDYFWVFLLGMATAFAEIIGKFPDEPLKSVKTSHAIFYHGLNGVIAVFALYVLRLFTAPPTDASGHLKNILAAGLGAMLVMRSKLFNLKIADEDVSFGPEQIIKIFLSFMEQAIDRIRSQNRIDFLKAQIEVLDFNQFDSIAEHVTAMMRSSQTRTTTQKEEFQQTIDQIGSSKGPKSKRNKCYALGFQLLNAMGEGFAVEVFKNVPSDLRRIAPSTPATSGLFANLFARNVPPPEITQYYLAYGTDMSGARFRERLKWSGEEFAKIPEAKIGALDKYRIVFNKPDEGDRRVGCANIVPDEKENIEGVLYTLSKDQIQFLDKETPGYTRKTVSVMVDSKPLDAEVYLAKKTSDSLKPDPVAISDLIKGAEEHKLSSQYITKLQGFTTDPDVETQS